MRMSSNFRSAVLLCVILVVVDVAPLSAGRAAVVISSDATKNFTCSAGVCTPTTAKAVLNVTQLTNMLVDEDVTIGTSAKAPDIRIDAPFSWTSAHQLTLQANRNIAVSRQVSDAGDGAIILVTRTGTLSFGKKGNIGFVGTSNPLTINGKSYLLAADVHSLAQLIARNPSGNFALARSYDAKADGRYSHSPIPTKFKGNLEGLGNTISNLHAECAG